LSGALSYGLRLWGQYHRLKSRGGVTGRAFILVREGIHVGRKKPLLKRRHLGSVCSKATFPH
jgi:hypothetical protein